MRILYFLPRPARQELSDIAKGTVPSERLYGAFELTQYGHHVDVADGRFAGRIGRLIRTLKRRGINACDLATLATVRRYDVVVVKDEFSALLTLSCRALGTPLVYLDAMFEPPRRWWKAAAIRAHLRTAAGSVGYSQTQIDAWARMFDVQPAKFRFVPYTIDLSFYQPTPRRVSDRPYVLAVGRDVGRHFGILVDAMEGLDIDLKIVTLPYLLRNINTDRPWIQVLQNIDYAELFSLYAGAALAAIPLRDAVTYPSGVRGMLEALALGTAVVSTRTPVLQEYAAEGEGVVYVPPGEPAALRAAIRRVFDDAGLRTQLEARGSGVARRFGMEAFARPFEAYLTALVRSRTAVRH